MTLRIKGATTIKGLTSVNWSPNLLFAAGEQGVWYDPSDFSTMFQDTAGTTPVTATGQSVARINDKSGNGNHATQSDAASRPTLQIDGNGKYYLSLDGSNDGLLTSTINFNSITKMTLWYGARKLTDAVAGYIVGTGTTTTTAAVFQMAASGTNGTDRQSWDMRVTGGNAIATIRQPRTYAAPITSVLSSQLDISTSATSSQIVPKVNGVAPPSIYDSGGTSIGTFANAPIYVGSGPSVFLPFNGGIYGVIVRGAASTASQIAMTEAYMNSKTAAY